MKGHTAQTNLLFTSNVSMDFETDVNLVLCHTPLPNLMLFSIPFYFIT